MVLAPPDIMNCNHNKEAFIQHKKKLLSRSIRETNAMAFLIKFVIRRI